MKLTQILHEDGEFTFDVNPSQTPIMVQPGSSTATISANNDNPIDTITVDVPLFIRLLEWAKEEAKDDMQLHHITEKLIKLSASGQPLSMNSYDDIVSGCCDYHGK